MMRGKPPKLTAQALREIAEWERARRNLGSAKHLAERYGVSKSTILRAIAQARGLGRMYKRELA